MFLYSSPQEGLAAIKASGEAWAKFDARTFEAARERREDEDPEDGTA